MSVAEDLAALPTSSPARTGPRRGRLRLVAAGLLLVTWHLRWTTAQTAFGAELVRGPACTGALAAAVLLGLWGLALTAFLTSSPPGFRAGCALTDAALALLATVLAAAGHAGVGAGAAGSHAPIFVPLVLLAVLEAALRLGGAADAPLVARLRGGAGLAGAIALGVEGQNLGAALALWLGVSPLLLDRLRSPDAVRRGVEGLAVVVCAAALFVLPLGTALEGAGGRYEGTYEGRFAWHVLAAGVLLLTTAELLRPSRGDVGRP